MHFDRENCDDGVDRCEAANSKEAISAGANARGYVIRKIVNAQRKRVD